MHDVFAWEMFLVSYLMLQTKPLLVVFCSLVAFERVDNGPCLMLSYLGPFICILWLLSCKQRLLSVSVDQDVTQKALWKWERAPEVQDTSSGANGNEG